MSERFLNFRDMFDGGGRGRHGDTFQGGIFSDLLNNIGVRPHGYRARQERGATSMRPQMRGNQPTPSTRAPQGLMAAPATRYGGQALNLGYGMDQPSPDSFLIDPRTGQPMRLRY